MYLSSATKHTTKSLLKSGLNRVGVVSQSVKLMNHQQVMGYFVVNRQHSSRFSMVNMQHNMRSFSSLPPHMKLEMPNLSPTMEKGNIAKWLKKEGDSIKPGDILAQIETDKATVDFEMQEEGFIAKLLYPEGAKDVKLGQVVAIVVESKDDIIKFADFKADGGASPAEPKKESAAPAKPAEVKQTSSVPQTVNKSEDGRIFASPLAKKTAEAAGLNLSTVQGSGPNNRIVKADVDQAVQSAGSKKYAALQIIMPTTIDTSLYTDANVSNIRKIIAERLSYSKQNIPHYYVTISVNVDNLLKLRGKLNSAAKSKISVNDMVLKAASLASVKVP